jgi:hypothetical protein
MSIRDALKKARALKEGKKHEEDERSYSAVKIYSELLHEEIWLVASKEVREQIADDLVAYLPGEIKHLTRINPSLEELRKIHDCKKLFPDSRIVWN